MYDFCFAPSFEKAGLPWHGLANVRLTVCCAQEPLLYEVRNAQRLTGALTQGVEQGEAGAVAPQVLVEVRAANHFVHPNLVLARNGAESEH